MSTEKTKNKKQGPGWGSALLMALPFAAALTFAALRWGTELKNLIHVVIKLVVIS